MKRIKLVTAYDGTNYHGSQIQNNSETIEGVLKMELSSLLKEDIQIIGASRTDAGVHARGNVFVFDTESRIPPEKFTYALNARLPADIRIQDSEEVPLTFHPRHQDTVKTYEYRVLNRKLPLPEYRLHTHFTYEALNIEKINSVEDIICELIYSSSIDYVNKEYIDIFMNTILEMNFRSDEKPYIVDIMQELYNFK